ncbi:hypothetical protein ACE103_09275 [Bradyrhizobium sp. ma5]|uniref:hypothetical protein n=1 Tax=Bradyrhizobium sp. ma5 TaxID=3344828 RepID=UPI0035D4F9B5
MDRVNVVVFQCPCGTAARHRTPHGERPVKPRHFRVGAGFVDEDETLRVKIDLPFEPLLTRGIYIAAPLLGGVRCLSLSVIFLRWKERRSDAMPARYSTRFQQFAQLGERNNRLRSHRLQNQLRMCFDALRFAVTALASRNDVANFLEAAAPADRAMPSHEASSAACGHKMTAITIGS